VLRTLALGMLTCAILAALFAVIADTVVEDGHDRFDRAAERWVHDHATPSLTGAMRLASDLASTPVATGLWIAMLGWLAARRRWTSAVFVAIAWPAGQGLVTALKLTLHRARPDQFEPFVVASGFSFPSGHTFTAIATYGLLAALLAEVLPRRLRPLPWLGAALVVAVVGFSRVELGVHYPTDVLGSVLVGGAWLRAVVTALHLAEKQPVAAGASRRRSGADRLQPRAGYGRSLGRPVVPVSVEVRSARPED
jgi:undecaprenyl-diphosphatase